MKIFKYYIFALAIINQAAVTSAAISAEAEKPVKVFEGSSDRVMSVAFSPDGKTLLAGSENNVVRLWDVLTGDLVGIVKDDSGMFSTVYISVAFTPDGSKAIVCTGNNNVMRKGTIEIYDVLSGKLLYKDDQVRAVSSIAVSPDGKTLLYSSWGSSLKLRDITSGKDIRSFEGHTDEVWSVAFSPDGRTALSGSWDKTLKLWNVATGREIRSFTGHSDMVWSVAFSPDGKRAVSGSVGATMWSEGEIKLWDISTGAEILSFKSKSRNINSLRFSPDGKFVISGSDLEAPRLWSAAKGEEISTLGDDTDSVLSVAFSKNGRMAATGASDGSVKLWDVSRIAVAGKSSPVTGERPVGTEIGTVQDIHGSQVIIGGSNIGDKVKLGDILSIDTGDGVVKIKAEFPMMTTARCSYFSGSKDKIKKGQKVYSADKK